MRELCYFFMAMLLASQSLADDHTHFDTECQGSDVTICVGMRSNLDLDRHCSNGDRGQHSYDAAEDAAKLVFRSGEGPISKQVRPAFPNNPCLDSNDTECWFQFEVKFPSYWNDPAGATDFSTHKAFQLSRGDTEEIMPGYYRGKGKLKFETKVGYGNTNTTAVGSLNFRAYDGDLNCSDCSTQGAKDSSGDLRYCTESRYCTPQQGDYNYDNQPGGDTWNDPWEGGQHYIYDANDHLKQYPTAYADRTDNQSPYLWMANTWHRLTYKWTRDNSGVERVTVWAANETDGPIKILADPTDPNQGYKIDWTADDSGFNQFWFEFDSSQDDRDTVEAYIYVRNLIVSESTIDLGGNPGEEENTFYVSTSAGGGGSGTSSGDPWTFAEAEAHTCSAGEKLLFKRGDDFTSSGLFTLGASSDGTSQNRITIGAYDSGADPKLQRIEIAGDYVTVQGLDIDGEDGAYDLVDISGNNVILDSLTIHDGLRDGVDINGDGTTITTIQDCTIHTLLFGPFGSGNDSHGITGSNIETVNISGTTIYQVSGDCVQFDPNRNTTNGTVNISDFLFYTAGLSAGQATVSGWSTGDIPGENAIDMKSDRSSPYTNTISWKVTNGEAYGWTDIPEISNRAAFRLKENGVFVGNRIKVHNCEIAYRITGGNGNVDVTVKNHIFYDCDTALRVDEELENLLVYNNTFGGDITDFWRENQQATHRGWDLRNNAFWGTKPTRFSDNTNKSCASDDFVNAASDHYEVAAGALSLINTGDNIAIVIVDFAGTIRSGDRDVGAYAYSGSDPGGENLLPTADAGPDQTVTDTDSDGSHSVTLDGSASSDPDGAISSYVWTEAGVQVATGSNPTLSLDVGSHTLTLTVSDDEGATDSDQVVITVNAGGTSNHSPVVETSPWAESTPVELPDTATLHVTASDPDGDALSYTWSVQSGPGDVQFDPNGTLRSDITQATFDAAGDYVLAVSVSDGDLAVSQELMISVTATHNGNPTDTGNSEGGGGGGCFISLQ